MSVSILRPFKNRYENIKKYSNYYGFYKTIKLWLFYKKMERLRKNMKLSEQQVEVNGYKMNLVPGDEGISLELLFFKTHEPLTTELMFKELKKGMICLDIGSNIGYYTLLESRAVGTQGKILAIEPSPINYEYLKKNVKLENADNIQTYNFAVGDLDDEIKFLHTKKSNRSIVIENDQEINSNDSIIVVPLKRLDSLIEELKIEKIDFLRMDVEGYEYNVYSGSRNLVRKFRPLIQLEIHKNYLGEKKTLKLLKLFKEDDYQIKYYTHRDMDWPSVGTNKDIKKFSIEKIINMMSQDKLPNVFSIWLESKNN